MGSLTIRNLDPGLKDRLRARAAEQGRSMEAEAQHILQSALSLPEASKSDLGARIRARFAPLGDVDLKLPAREEARDPPDFA
jgi:plasmid stability protein